MKTRFDFVSNSSSCSFIVNDMNHFMEKLKTLSSTKDGKDIDSQWMYCLSIRFVVKNTEVNREVFKKFIDRYTSIQANDQTIECCGDFDKILSIDPQYFSSIKDAEVYAYDDGDHSDVQKIMLLYWAMRSEGVNVDNSCSEHDYMLFTDVPEQLVNAAMKMFVPNHDLS